MKPVEIRKSTAVLRIVSILALLIVTLHVNGQAITPAVMQMAQSELSKRGLTETEVRSKLMKEGIDVDNISPTEYASYQPKIMSILDEMVAEKKNKTKTISRPDDDTKSTFKTTADSIKKASKDLKEVKDIKEVKTPKKYDRNAIYGHEMFTDKSLEVIKTADGGQAPDTYILGEGDVIHITIFGASQTEIQQRLDADGSIQPSGVARIFLKGLTLGQARRVIRESLSKSYLFRADQLAVTVVTTRTLLVNVFGETNVSGGFSLSALNSALNALSAAGGPTEKGSVRNIQLIRGNSRKDIDLYDFMNNPAAQYSMELQNNDILYVPVAKTIVSVEGAVKRPMRYEMRDGETLQELIGFAGGLSKDAYPEFIQVQRYVNGEQKLLEWNLSDVMAGRVKVSLSDGDFVRIKSINKPLSNFITVDGSVYYPGKFDLNTNKTLLTAIQSAKPTLQAKLDQVFIERTRPDSTVEFLSVPYPTNQANDFALQNLDKIHVMNLVSYRDEDTIAVVGLVRKPFSKVFAYKDHITIGQAIEYAGGLKENAYNIAYIFRKNLSNPIERQYIRVNLSDQKDLYLQAGDQLNIYDKSTYSNVGELRISGAVKNPSSYIFDPSMSLTDLINNGGGFALGAAYNRVEIFRTTLSTTERPKLELITLSVDSSYRLVMPKTFRLHPYDQVVVRMTPEFTMGRTVEVNGQVKYPGVYVLESKDATVADVIRKAGGLLKDADSYGSELFRTYKNRGHITIQIRKALRHPNNYAYNPVLFEGDVINVNRMENTVRINSTGTRISQYSTDSIDTYKNIVYQGRRPADWYIENFAGGFQKNADRSSVTVTYPNNQMQSTKHFMGFRFYPVVLPGSTINLKMDQEKVKKAQEPKNKLDFETTVSKTLSVLTSTLSVILLVKSLNK